MIRTSIVALIAIAACDSSPAKQPPPAGRPGDPSATTVVVPAGNNAAAATVVMPLPGGAAPAPPAPPAPPSSRSDNVVVDAAQVDGDVDPDAIRDLVRRRLGVLRDCYEGAARSAPSLEGDLAVAFALGKSGRPSKLAVTGSLASNQGLATCVTGVFQGLELPGPASGTAAVTVPLDFGPIR